MSRILGLDPRMAGGSMVVWIQCYLALAKGVGAEARGFIIGATVALIGSVISNVIAVLTVKMQLKAAGAERLWHRRASTYGDLLAVISHRQAERALDDRRVRTDPKLWTQLWQDLQAEKPAVPWPDLQGRVNAFASHQVVSLAHYAAIEERTAAVAERELAFWRQLRPLQRLLISGSIPAKIYDAERQRDGAVARLNDLELRLVEQVRSELNDRP